MIDCATVGAALKHAATETGVFKMNSSSFGLSAPAIVSHVTRCGGSLLQTAAVCIHARGPAQREEAGGAPLLESRCGDGEGEVC